MRRSPLLAFSVQLIGAVSAFSPVAYHVGTAPEFSNLTAYDVATGSTQLSASQPVLTLDYGSEVAGWPFIEVESVLGGPAQVEFKYSEQWNGLNEASGDGPFPFAVTLANSFRTETFNISGTGRIESSLLQGGLRWQSITLINGSGVTVKDAGIRASVPDLTLGELPGRFNSSNSLYDEIWALGARTMQVSCLEAGSQPSTWEVTSEGAFIAGQQAAVSAKGVGLGNYTLNFRSRIVRGGLGWKVAATSTAYGPYFVLTSEYPAGATFANTNRTLLPPNHLVVGFGYSLVNQTSVQSGPLQYYSLPSNLSLAEQQWHDISTAITPEGYVVVVDDIHVATVPLDEAEAWTSPFGASKPATDGTWGFGPYLDQAAYFTNVSVLAANGSVIYQNSLTSAEDTLPEYGVSANYHSFCSDGAKRDRLVWIGVDWLHGQRTLAASTNRLDFATGTMAAAFDWQDVDSGLIAINAQMGADSAYKTAFADVVYSITDWELYFLASIGDYYRLTGDTTTIAGYWTQLKLLVTALLSNVDPYSGLMAGSGYYFFAGTNGSAPSLTTALALDGLAAIATAVGDNETAAAWGAQAEALASAVEAQLWNEELGTHVISLSDPGNYSILSSVMPILRAGSLFNNASQSSGNSTTQRSETFARALTLINTTLSLGSAFKDSSAVVEGSTGSNNRTQLSPNINGFLLEALLVAHRDYGISGALEMAARLLDTLWGARMARPQDEYYTGTAWEYIYAEDGTPGLDYYTSHAHEWATAPTYVLSQYVLGIEPGTPGFATWRFRPLLSSALGNLTRCAGAVPTPHGAVNATWELEDGNAGAHVYAVGPAGTVGVLNIEHVAGASCFVGGTQLECSKISTDDNGIIDAIVRFA